MPSHVEGILSLSVCVRAMLMKIFTLLRSNLNDLRHVMEEASDKHQRKLLVFVAYLRFPLLENDRALSVNN